MPPEQEARQRIGQLLKAGGWAYREEAREPPRQDTRAERECTGRASRSLDIDPRRPDIVCMGDARRSAADLWLNGKLASQQPG